MWHDEISHLTCWTKKFGGGRGKLREKERERKGEEEKRREKLLILSSFLGDPVVGVRQNKRQSSFSRRELQVETEIMEFRKTLRGRGFSYSVLFLD